MIDLHCHLLPGLDDGPPTLDASLAIGRAARGAGVTTIVATPHVREDYPFDPARIPDLVGQVNAAFDAEDLGVHALAGGELALTKTPEMADEEIQRVALGGGPYVLVESPYVAMTDLLDQELFNLQVRGFRPLLAHPERSPSFIRDVSRLAELVERGILCSLTAGSLAGRFGRTVQRACVEMLSKGLVHNVASDAHAATGRGPGLLWGFDALEEHLPGIAEQAPWYTQEAPAAVLSGEDLPPRPAPPSRGGRLARLLGRG
ncbi:MAG: tyrosine-protein phosphatase [Thermoleophilaceae bacterium]